MGIEGFSRKKVPELEKERIQTEEQLIAEGAEMVTDEHGAEHLEVTPLQVNRARGEMTQNLAEKKLVEVRANPDAFPPNERRRLRDEADRGYLQQQKADERIKQEMAERVSSPGEDASKKDNEEREPDSQEISEEKLDDHFFKQGNTKMFESTHRLTGVLHKREQAGFAPFIDDATHSRISGAGEQFANLASREHVSDEDLSLAARSLENALREFGTIPSPRQINEDVESLKTLRFVFVEMYKNAKDLRVRAEQNPELKNSVNTLGSLLGRIDTIGDFLGRKISMLNRMGYR